MSKIIFVLLFVTTEAFAWGPTGHRVVGEVAQKFLDVKVQSKVAAILGGQTLARVSTWSDEIKSEPETYSHTFNWHYTDWKDEDHQHDETHSSGLLLTSLSEQVAVLKDEKASLDKKNFALKFIVHLVGDLHMPLHVGNGLDQGGNKCRVLFHNKQFNLHALWDEGLIDYTGLSYSELTNFVSQGRSIDQIRLWKSGTPVDWALESKILRTQIYPENVTASAAPMSVKEYCRSDITVATEHMPKLGYEYSYKFMPVIERRLYQAGVRLAVILNDALK
jgi:hypothetical protein